MSTINSFTDKTTQDENKSNSSNDKPKLTEKEILKISTELQCELIKKLVISEENEHLLTEMLNNITKKAHEQLDADACSIFVNNEGNKNSEFAAGTGHYEIVEKRISYTIVPPDEVPPPPKKYKKLGITGWIISTGRSFISSKMDDLNNHPHHIGQGIPEGAELSAFLGVPLRTPRGIINGAIKAERYYPKTEFLVIEQILLENLAQIAGRCIAHVHDAGGGIRQKNAAIIAWALDVIAEAVSSEEELDALLNIIVKVISAASNADACSIYLIDESKKTLTQRAGVGSQGLQKGIRAYRLPESNPILMDTISNLALKVKEKERIGITPWIAYTERQYYARNFAELCKHPHHIGVYDGINFIKKVNQCGCWYGVPVRIGGNTIGVLKIENISPVDKIDEREFSNDVQNRVDSLSQNIALAIERSQFRIKSGTNILQDASKTIFEILRGNTGVKELVSNVVQETSKLFNARACALFLKEGEKKLIQPPWAAVGWASRGEKGRKYDLVDEIAIKENPTEAEKVGLTVWIAVKNKKFSARSNLELTMHPHHKGTFDKQNFVEGEKCESFMGVPLYVGKDLIGVLKVETKKSRDQKEFTYFSEQDELAFEFIANSAAIAIQNSRLVESNVLADRILVQHDNTSVLRELYEFISGRAEWVNTLGSTKTIVDRKNQEKAKIIGFFAGLLEPDFQIFHLEQLSPLIGDDKTKSFFEFVMKACKSETLDEIINFDLSVLGSFNFPIDHFLNKNATLLSDISGIIRDNLKQYDSTVGTRIRLENVINVLNDKTLKEKIEGMNPFDISIIKKILLNIERVVNIYYKQFHKVISPYRTGLPLEPDSKLFFGRSDIFKWIETKINTNKHNVLVLHGGSRTGKTSILRQLEAGQSGSVLRKRKDSPIFPVFVDLHSFADCNTEIFLFTLAEKIWEKHEIFKSDIAVPKPGDFQNGLHYRAFEKFLKEVTELLYHRKKSILVLMLDEFETIEDLIDKKKIENSIYRYLRSQMQHQHSITYILAGHYRLSELKNAENDVILNIADHKEVGFLSKADTIKLIVEPVKIFAIEYPQDVIEKIYIATNGHPFFVQQICNNSIEILNERGENYKMSDEVLQEAIEKSIDPGSVPVLNELWNSADSDGQKLLKGMAQMISWDIEWIDRDFLKREGNKIKITRDIDLVLEHLVKMQLIQVDYETNRIKFAFDLFRLYIIKHRLRIA